MLLFVVCSLWRVEVGAPQIVARMRNPTGAWMRDPKTRNDDIFVLMDYEKVNHLRHYKSEELLADNNASHVYTMPFRCTGTGHVMYNGSLFCNKFRSNRLMKYSIDTNGVTSRRLTRAAFNNTCPYSIRAFTDMDFAVDEAGLWLIYASNKNIIIGKISPETLQIKQKWSTTFPKIQALNSFMICGRLYVVEQRKDWMEVTYVYDTRTGKGWSLSPGEILISTTSGYVSMVDYNPKDSRLYVWQSSKNYLGEGELVIYDVFFKDST